MSVAADLLAGRRLLLIAGAVLLLVLVVGSFVPRLLAEPPAEDLGAGPPDSSVVPPLEEDTFAPLALVSMPSGPACAWLSDEELSAAAGGPLSSSATPGGCTWSGVGLEVELSTLEQPITLAIVEFAEDWPDYPEVVAEPANGLFFMDGDRAALLLDAGTSTVVVQNTEAGADRLTHWERLVSIAELLAT